MKRRAFLAAIPAVAVAAKYAPASGPYITANVWTTGRSLTEPMMLSLFEQMRAVNELRSMRLDAAKLSPPVFWRG